MDVSRQPEGTPAGGQFAATAHAEGSVALEVPPPTRTVKDDGTVQYRDDQGRLHRLDGPASVAPDGTQTWYDRGLWSRADGPASIKPDGSTTWALDGVMHRENGPAVENARYLEWWNRGVNSTGSSQSRV